MSHYEQSPRPEDYRPAPWVTGETQDEWTTKPGATVGEDGDILPPKRTIEEWS
ncbi:hypothetical protein [uncultured Halomonas sp.]|uniref:hypothetical protein n=1 Tax=uncultured Halomonas sp. TaxID=173971 RepID=UPI002631F405|nr:hypothetical protein [uncultured Halomonas sp.]